MSTNKPDSPEREAERERRKNLTEGQIDELELAGGVEGGMQAGSAGGPGQGDAEKRSTSSSGEETRNRADR